MNTALRNFVYPVIVALSLGAAFAVRAESPTADDTATQVWTQAKTRDQVKAELFAARADGTSKVYAYTYNPLMLAKSTLTREEVRAQARVDREMAVYASTMLGEDSGSFVLSQQWTARPASSRTVAKAAK
jgi:hypothetical protein